MANLTAWQDEIEAALAAARAGDPAGFDSLFTHFAGPVRAFARTRGAEDPEALTNDVLHGVFRGLGSFRGGGSDFRAWVFRIARNKLIDDHRRRNRRPISVSLDVAEPTLPDGTGALLDRELLTGPMSELTDRQREVLVLRFVLDLPIAEVASITNRPVTAVKATQRRALAALRRSLTDPGPVVSPDIDTTITSP